jgi:heme/copper-type cytochrome/quinol oxidase subunit 3
VSATVGNGVVPEAEDPRTLRGNLQVGSRLLASAAAFLFISFLFAFFYLRALNSNGQFKPPHTNPSQAYGIAILVCVVAAAVVFDVARRRLDRGVERPWRTGAGVALALGLAAVGVQVAQYFNLGFGPGSGGYASVFVGWTGLFVFFLLGAIYWIETLFAQSLRRDSAAAGGGDIEDPAALLRPSADAAIIYLYALAVIEVFAYVLLYLVK